MKPSSDEDLILYTGVLNESCLNYLAHDLPASESGEPPAGYPDRPSFNSELAVAPAHRKWDQVS